MSRLDEAPVRTAPPEWAGAIAAHGGAKAGRRLVPRLAALERAALAFCRLLERWARGDADPSTAPARTAALHEAAEAVDAALDDLEKPLARYLFELEPDHAEGRTWFGEPGMAELVDWAPVLSRAGVDADPNRVTAAYLDLAILVRALSGLAASVSYGAMPDHASLWAGLFDLRENLFGRVQDEVRALAA
jgi:hypothetical protein